MYDLEMIRKREAARSQGVKDGEARVWSGQWFGHPGSPLREAYEAGFREATKDHTWTLNPDEYKLASDALAEIAILRDDLNSVTAHVAQSRAGQRALSQALRNSATTTLADTPEDAVWKRLLLSVADLIAVTRPSPASREIAPRLHPEQG